MRRVHEGIEVQRARPPCQLTLQSDDSSWSTSCRKERDVQDFLPAITQASTTLVALLIRGGFVMIPLLTASVVAVTVIHERLVFWRGLRVRRGATSILALVAEGDLPQAMQVASASRHPVARVLASGRSRRLCSSSARKLQPDPTGAGVVISRRFRGADALVVVQLSSGLTLYSYQPSTSRLQAGERVIVGAKLCHSVVFAAAASRQEGVNCDHGDRETTPSQFGGISAPVVPSPTDQYR